MNEVFNSTRESLRNELHRYEVLSERLEAREAALWSQMPWNEATCNAYINLSDQLRAVQNVCMNLRYALGNLDDAAELLAKATATNV